MINSQVKKEILHQLEHLTFERQKQLLGYARMMDNVNERGVEGKQLLTFSGAIEGDNLKEMEKYIEEGCELVDADAW